jgi:hypothetical protein
VVKLHVIDEKGGELLQIAAVVGIENRGIERRDGFVEFRLRFGVLESRHRLGVHMRGNQGEQSEG